MPEQSGNLPKVYSVSGRPGAWRSLIPYGKQYLFLCCSVCFVCGGRIRLDPTYIVSRSIACPMRWEFKQFACGASKSEKVVTVENFMDDTVRSCTLPRTVSLDCSLPTEFKSKLVGNTKLDSDGAQSGGETTISLIRTVFVASALKHTQSKCLVKVFRINGSRFSFFQTVEKRALWLKWYSTIIQNGDIHLVLVIDQVAAYLSEARSLLTSSAFWTRNREPL